MCNNLLHLLYFLNFLRGNKKGNKRKRDERERSNDILHCKWENQEFARIMKMLYKFRYHINNEYSNV